MKELKVIVDNEKITYSMDEELLQDVTIAKNNGFSNKEYRDNENYAIDIYSQTSVYFSDYKVSHPSEVEEISVIWEFVGEPKLRCIDNKMVKSYCHNYKGNGRERWLGCENEPLDHIKLDNGKVLINHYGKYKSGLTFILDYPFLCWESVDKSDLNLNRGDYEVLYGNFFESKKGTKCFKVLPKEKASHKLIRDDWGGSFNSYRGRTLPETNSLYYKRASSNGGGSGYDYAIYQRDWKNTLSEEDI